MRRKRQSPDETPEYLPSTTRAVAWGAMFFAFLSFVISLVTLFLTYQDGRLVRNFQQVSGDLRAWYGTWSSRREESPDATQRAKIREQLDRYIGMIGEGDGQVRFYLEGLRSDLESLQAYATEDSGVWIGEARRTVEEAIEQLRADAPGAAERLRALAQRLRRTSEPARASTGDAAVTTEERMP